MAGARPTLVQLTDPARRDADGRWAVRIHLDRAWREDEGYAELAEAFEIVVERARILGKVLVRAELKRVDEDRNDPRVDQFRRAGEVHEVASVKCPKGRRQ